MLDRPLSTYSVWECHGEIQKRLDTSIERDKDIDLLIYQMAVLWQNDSNALRDWRDTVARALLFDATARRWMLRMHRDYHGKPIPWAELRSAIQYCDAGHTPEWADAQQLRLEVADA